MYIVEGNIGVGKSTFLTLMEKLLPACQIIPEPVDSWNHQAYGASLLSLFYENPQRWAYTLETLALKCRVRDHLAEQKIQYPYRLMERSIYSGHYVFATNDLEAGYLTELEWTMYQKWIDFLVHGHCKLPRGFIYLRAEPQVCFDRMKIRNRSSESTVSIEYLTLVHTKHDQFLLRKEGVEASLAKIPVLTIDCNEEFQASPARQASFAASVEAFFNETTNGSYQSLDKSSNIYKNVQKRV